MCQTVTFCAEKFQNVASSAHLILQKAIKTILWTLVELRRKLRHQKNVITELANTIQTHRIIKTIPVIALLSLRGHYQEKNLKKHSTELQVDQNRNLHVCYCRSIIAYFSNAFNIVAMKLNY